MSVRRQRQRHVKVLFLGPRCGKTTFAKRLAQFPQHLENAGKIKLTIGADFYQAAINEFTFGHFWDVSSSETAALVSPLMRAVDVFVLCFDVCCSTDESAQAVRDVYRLIADNSAGLSDALPAFVVAGLDRSEPLEGAAASGAPAAVPARRWTSEGVQLAGDIGGMYLEHKPGTSTMTELGAAFAVIASLCDPLRMPWENPRLWSGRSGSVRIPINRLVSLPRHKLTIDDVRIAKNVIPAAPRIRRTRAEVEQDERVHEVHAVK